MPIQDLEKLLKMLKEVGLTANEANIYLASLSIGPNPVSTIAKKAGVNRSSCYATLEKLVQKGFIRELICQNISYYNAVEPKYILNQLQTKRVLLEDQIENLSILLNNINLLQDSHQSSKRVAFFEGEAGIKSILEDTLNASTELRAYASLSELVNLLPNYFPAYYKRRAAKGIFAKVIYPEEDLTINHKTRDTEELRESRLIPKEFDFKLDIVIYDNKVSITSLTEKFGVTIESKEIAEAQKRIFDLIWDKIAFMDKIICTRSYIQSPKNHKEQIKKPSTELRGLFD